MLIVENHAYMRSILRRFLHLAFPEQDIHEAGDGASALAHCRDHRPAVVLMDIELPDANGIELTAQIRRMLPGTAVITVSSHASAEHGRRALAAGACSHVTKYGLAQDLIPAVKAALARQPPTPTDHDPEPVAATG